MPPDDDAVERYITGQAGTADAVVYIYQDGVQVTAQRDVLRLEDWDVDTPDQMIAQLCAVLATLESTAR